MRSSSVVACLGLLVATTSARADAPAPVPAAGTASAAAERRHDPQVERLRGSQRSLAWNYTPHGSTARYGHAEAFMEASAATMTRLATDFAHYKDLNKKFASARVVTQHGDSTDVFMRYPVRIGPIQFDFAEVMRFGPLRTEGDVRILEAWGVQGDMKQGHARIKIRPVGPNESLVEVDILLVPKMPAPQSLIDAELRDGAHDFVRGLGARATAARQI